MKVLTHKFSKAAADFVRKVFGSEHSWLRKFPKHPRITTFANWHTFYTKNYVIQSTAC
ncbi:hypothetical protein FHS68_003242 [Dyadobacter arcticus]|uniref:Transposase n=1 Tax=Dyadobacter arcticus TaxID=1078754 RepID=A0ABX0UQT7_9BACT|nr:hypothetical protein [Dyadobacter arcticus]